MSLTTLPILPLEVIISYLDFSSIVSLANSHPSLAHLQPKEQIIIGENFYISGEGGVRECRSSLRVTLTSELKPRACKVSRWSGNGEAWYDQRCVYF